MAESSVFSGKFVTYKVERHARCTLTSVPSMRFLSLVSAAGMLSCTKMRTYFFERLITYPRSKFDGRDKNLWHISDFDFLYLAALRK